MSTEVEVLMSIALDDIWCDEEFNSRQHISPASVATFADEIERDGMFHNPIVQEYPNPHLSTSYKMVMGHRRYEAFKLNRKRFPGDPRWTHIQCKVKSRLLESEARIMNLKENMGRENLNMLQEAKSIAWFKREGWQTQKVAKELNVSKKWVEIRYGLLALPEEIQRRAEADYLNVYQIEECIKKATREEQLQYVRNIVDHKERGKKITAESPEEKRKKDKAKALMTKGSIRSMSQLSAVQLAIQDSFKDIRHPAAIALGFAMGVIGYDELVPHIDKWVTAENDRRASENLDPIRYTHPETIKVE